MAEIGYFYIITNQWYERDETYKLGKWSGNQEDLLNRYRTYLIYPKLILFIKVAQYSKFEATVHEHFAKNRLANDLNNKSEWFTTEFSDININDIVNYAKELSKAEEYNIDPVNVVNDINTIYNEYKAKLTVDYFYSLQSEHTVSSIKYASDLRSLVKYFLLTVCMNLEGRWVEKKMTSKGIVNKSTDENKLKQKLKKVKINNKPFYFGGEFLNYMKDKVITPVFV
ncbi:hypothetical protein F-liban_198 [Faustovirus]|nr:hypothetical protein F-liban_198 [Faustovirus]SME64871.1 T5orf172 domain-containing protein [Faustovirus ST1]